MSAELNSPPASTRGNGADSPVVFFDGVCGVCNRTVDFLMRHDRQGRLRFAPLQGETARDLLPESDRKNLNTLVLRLGTGRTYVRSAAAVRVLRLLGGGWRIVAALLWLVPLPLRNLGYRGFASMRYRLLGKHETCRMPTEADRARLLP